MITDIRLQNFRIYTDESFEFDPGVNIIVGANASGKTSLLEAILVVCRGGSYRVNDADLIRFDEVWLRLDTHTQTGERTVKVTKDPIPQKTFTIDTKPYKRLPVAQTIPVVLFEPNHLQLLTGTPDLRREYLDNLIEQSVVGYGSLRRQYRRTLAQRNVLLKQGAHGASELFAWNIRLSELGSQIARRRMELVARFDGRLAELYANLSGARQAVASVAYESRCVLGQYGSDMLHKLEQSVDLDMARGFTAYGPHRDDMVLRLNRLPLVLAASRGEVRTLLLALKIVEMELLHEYRGVQPLLLLDDVFSELDGSRRRALTEALKDRQAFITTTDADVVLKHFTQDSRVIPVAGVA